MLPEDHELITESAKLRSIISRYYSQALLCLEENVRIRALLLALAALSEEPRWTPERSFSDDFSASVPLILLPETQHVLKMEKSPGWRVYLGGGSAEEGWPTDVWLVQMLEFTCSTSRSTNIMVWLRPSTLTLFLFFFKFCFHFTVTANVCRSSQNHFSEWI